MAVSADINVMRKEDCPECGTGIQVTDEFRKWCPSCEWNMGEVTSELSSSRIERIYDKIGTRQGSKLFDWIKNQQPDQLRPRWTGSKITAFVLASLVHLISLSLLGLGFWFLSFGWPAILMMLIGVVLIGMAWFMRPRFGSMPEGYLTREDSPELFNLCDRIADQVGSPRVDGILIDGDYNAAFARVGLPRKTLLVIGLPLWLQESWPERIGTLSHEFSHGANGDSSRGLYVGSALNSLEELMSFMRPEYDPDNGISGMLAHYAMWLASVPFALLHMALSHLLWRQSQIAEFLADYLATTACGTKAMKASLRNNSYGEHFYSFMRKNIFSHQQKGRDILDRYVSFMENLPEQERERLTRLASRENAKLDATHPPTSQRIAFLEAHPVEGAYITVGPLEQDRIEQEMDRWKDLIGDYMIDLWAPER